MKKSVMLMLASWACQALSESIELTVEPVTNLLLVTEASNRFAQPPKGIELTDTFPHPDTGWPTTVTGNNIVHLSDDMSLEAQAWARTNAFRVDFFACIKNVSTNTLSFYDEWNSWGFYQLKIICYGGREIWIPKQSGVWYRNFPSWVSLHPGEALRIPVAFEDALWDGVAKAKSEKYTTAIRVFYDQFATPHAIFGDSENLWQGSVFSPLYDIGMVLPRRGFKTAKR